MTFLKTLADEFSSACTTCGACAAMCPALSATGPVETPSAIQEQVREFLEGGPPTGTVIDRALLCNECYQCTVDTCPVALDPMRTNLLLRGCLREQGVWAQQDEFTPPSDPASDERVLAALLTTDEEFKRITTSLRKGDGRFLFFPGCNIYSMPDKLLTAMDIMDRLADGWSFLPGLANCCGGNHDTAGYLEAGLTSMSELADSFQSDEFEAIVLWCPTCVTRFHLSELDLPTISFARFVADRIADQGLSRADIGPITLHDPCKNAFLRIDPEAPRELLILATGEKVREMPRIGTCCGWSLFKSSPDEGRRWINERIKEASDTGAEAMVNICHGCHWLFTGPEQAPDIEVVNYVTLMGRVMGICHDERYFKWRKWGDPDTILSDIWTDIEERIDQFPFTHLQIEMVIRRVFGPVTRADVSG